MVAGAAQGTEMSSEPKSTSLFNYSNLKNALKKYGRTGVVVYLGISLSVTTGFYIAIERHFDVKKYLGIKDDPSAAPTFFERVLVGKGSSFALAMLCSKALIPIKLPVAVAVTPYVHRMKERLWGTAVQQAVRTKVNSQ